MKARRTALLLALSAAVAAPSQATHIVITLPAPSIYIAVGTMGATIDTVTFPLGAQPVGTPISQLEAPILIEAAHFRGGGGMPNFAYVTMTPTPPGGLTDGTFSVPWTTMSWVSSNTKDFPSGTFTGAPNQALSNFGCGANKACSIEASFTFSYSNATPVASGTYNGRVTFTITTP